MSIDILIKKILLNKKHIVMIYLKDFFAKFLLTNFSSWVMAVFVVLFVLSLICLFVASRFDDPFKEGSKLSAGFGYFGLICASVASILVFVLLCVEFVALFVFLALSQLAFGEFLIRFAIIVIIFLVMIYLILRAN